MLGFGMGNGEVRGREQWQGGGVRGASVRAGMARCKWVYLGAPPRSWLVGCCLVGWLVGWKFGWLVSDWSLLGWVHTHTHTP